MDTPHQELVGFLKRSDNYTQDTREWPDPTEPRATKPPAPKGCTCHKGLKLDCPIHGLNSENPWDETLDHSWSMPENNPIGYPQDQPRNWTQVTSRQWNPVVVSDSQSEFVPFDSQAIDVKERFVPFIPIQHRSGPVIESTENVGHRAKGDSVNFEGFFGHNSTEHVAVHSPGINDVSHIGGDNNVQTYDYPDTPHAKPERRWSVKQTFSDSTPPESIPSVEGFHT